MGLVEVYLLRFNRKIDRGGDTPAIKEKDREGRVHCSLFTLSILGIGPFV